MLATSVLLHSHDIHVIYVKQYLCLKDYGDHFYWNKLFHHLGFVVLYLEHCSFNVKHK